MSVGGSLETAYGYLMFFTAYDAKKNQIFGCLEVVRTGVRRGAHDLIILAV